MIDYVRETRDAYLTAERAASYKRYNSTDWTWGRFTTWIELRAVRRELRRHQWSAKDRLLDIPCGAGILGSLLKRFPFRVTAGDISAEMLVLARPEYAPDRLEDCVKADITATPFARGSFSCVVALSFLHRVPLDVKRAALRELAALTRKLLIVSCSVDDPFQRLKHRALSKLRRRHVPAPCPLPMSEIVAECEAQGLRVIRAFRILPGLSAAALFVLEKPEPK